MKNLIYCLPFLLVLFTSCNQQNKTETISNSETEKTPISKKDTVVSVINTTTTNEFDKNIRSIFQDNKGNYWFGTNGAGVYRYDGKRLTQFTVKEGLANNQIQSIQEDKFGNIWFGTGTFGVSKFDGQTFTTLTNDKNFQLSNGTNSNWKIEPNDLLFYAGGGVFRYNYSSLNYLPFAKSSSNAQTKNPFSLSRYGAFTVSEKTRKKMFGLALKQKEYANMTGKHLVGLRKKDWQARPFLVYLKTARAIFGLEIMVRDYLDMMENL